MSRNAVVTGGGTGIGAEVAARLVAAGVDVVITGRRKDVLAEADLPGRVDVLVNAAGGNTDLPAGPPATGDLAGLRDSWLANFEANVLSAVLVTSALLPRLADNARIVNLGSVTARSGQGSYGAVKAAVEPWTTELAFQLGTRGVPPHRSGDPCQRWHAPRALSRLAGQDRVQQRDARRVVR